MTLQSPLVDVRSQPACTMLSISLRNVEAWRVEQPIV